MKFSLVKKNSKKLNQNNPFLRDGVFLKESKYGGKGVFTNKPIKQGEVVEIAPYLLVPINDISENNTLKDYVFQCDDCNHLLVLGYGSMYNHQDNPNLKYQYNDNGQGTFLGRFANRDIECNEELCISYGDGYWSGREIKKVV